MHACMNAEGTPPAQSNEEAINSGAQECRQESCTRDIETRQFSRMPDTT
jgi:hypothetical protein